MHQKMESKEKARKNHEIDIFAKHFGLVNLVAITLEPIYSLEKNLIQIFAWFSFACVNIKW